MKSKRTVKHWNIEEDLQLKGRIKFGGIPTDQEVGIIAKAFGRTFDSVKWRVDNHAFAAKVSNPLKKKIDYPNIPFRIKMLYS